MRGLLFGLLFGLLPGATLGGCGRISFDGGDSAGGAAADLGFGVAVPPTEQVVVAGSFTGTSALEGLTLTSEARMATWPC